MSAIAPVEAKKDPKLAVVEIEMELAAEADRTDHFTKELIGYVSLVMSRYENYKMDDAEFVRLVAEINELHKERREGSKRMDRIIQQLHDLTISSTEICRCGRLAATICELNKKRKEETDTLDHFMEQLNASCGSRLASFFERSFEE